MIQIDDSISNFEKFKNKISDFINHDLNESDTRSKLIDTILIDVLGWTEQDIKREGKIESGYFDYEVSAPGINFIIEAKRNFKELSIPSKHKKAKIKSIYSENEEFFKQIRSYAIDIGIQYGILTNGRQFILTKLFNTDGKNWQENECLLFNGLEDIQSRFIEFFENFSKYSVVHNGGFIFDFPVKKFESHTILSTLIDRDKELVRNSLSIQLTPIIERIFGEIFSDNNENDEEFIKKCFVENNETKKNRDEIDRLFGDKAPQICNVVKAVNTSSIKKQISTEINQDEINIRNLVPPKPIVIVGSKGAGKTTFINHLFMSGDKEGLKNHLVVYIDLRAFFDSYSAFEHNNIAKHILEKTLDSYPDLELHSIKALKRIYSKHIKENDESIWFYEKQNNEASYQSRLTNFFEEVKKDYPKHLENLNKYLIKDHRKRIIVVIDNADQYTSDIQEKVFLFAHSLAKSSYCGSIISLREGYYYKWRYSPPFDAYESNVYHITAPKYSEVLLKRIDFTLEKLEEINGVAKGKTDKGYNLEVPNQAVIEFMSGLKDSLFSATNTELIDYLNYTTFPNIREGLRVFKQFLVSGHTNVMDYILRERFKTLDRENKQVIPIFEFIKAIGLHNKLYYNSEFSLIHNLFIPPLDSNDHFIKFYILKEMYDIMESKGNANKYILINDLIEKFTSMGYRVNVIIDSFINLIKFNLLDTDEQLSDIEWNVLPKNLNIGITSKGYYYYKELSTRFHYIDLCLQDTPIFDKTEFNKLKEVFPLSDESGKRLLSDRYEVVNIFMNYLKQREDKQPNNLKIMYGDITSHIKNGLSTDLKRIEKKI